METTAKKIADLPHTPGVYLFKDGLGQTIYVGKAVDLKRRVQSYFKQLPISSKTGALVRQIKDLEIGITGNEFEALLLEAKLIRKLQPRYNVVARDDKTPLYLVVTRSETIPRVMLCRKTQITNLKKRDVTFGPFSSTRTIRSLLREIRRVVPFCTAKNRRGNRCFYTHLGLCDPCPGEIVGLNDTAQKQQLGRHYRRNIARLCDILSGKSVKVARQMETEMKILARAQNFEAAAKLRDHLEYLNVIIGRHHNPHLYDNPSIDTNRYQEETQALASILSPYFSFKKPLTRIEAFDIANLGEEAAVGSLVVLINGQIDTSQYRRFRIKTVNGINDAAMIREVIERRLKHPNWPLPDLLVVDGGKPQVSATLSALNMAGHKLPVIGLAKRQEEIVVPQKFKGFTTIRLPLNDQALQPLRRIRDEAHRFAGNYHRWLRRKLLSATIKKHEISGTGIRV